MKSLPLLIGLALAIIAGITEILVLNEECLLALCFVSFVFFAFNYLNQTVTSFFSDFALKIEAELLSSFQLKYNTTIVFATQLTTISKITKALVILHTAFSKFSDFNYNNAKNQQKGKMSSLISLKLNELVLKQKEFKNVLQLTKIKAMVFPLVFSCRSIKIANFLEF